MAHDRLAPFLIGVLEQQPHAHLLGARTTHAELEGQVSAQRSSDEQQSLSVLHRRLELAMRASEHRWAPGGELIRLEAPGEEYRVASFSPKLALQLARSNGGDSIERAQTKQVEPLHRLFVELQLTSGKWGKECARLIDLDQAPPSRSPRGEPGGERTWCQPEPCVHAHRCAQTPPCFAN